MDEKMTQVWAPKKIDGVKKFPDDRTVQSGVSRTQTWSCDSWKMEHE